MDLSKLSKQQKLQLIEAVEEQARRKRENQFSYAFPDEGPFARANYPKQMEFFAAGAEYKERAFIAGNRTGKSFAGAFELTCHLTGLYPEWWKGKRFSRPVQAWAGGKTNETVRDVIQEKFLGPIKSQYGEGMIPKYLFTKAPTTRPGLPDAAQDIYVRHVSGGVSKLTLKSYQQGRDAYEGAAIDVIWFDEEPPSDIYSEALTRTATTRGILLCTFTPLAGLSDVVLSFLPAGLFPLNGTVGDNKFVTNATWSDTIPHLCDEEKEIMKSAYSAHELEARTHGLPSIGSGRIYPIAEADIVVAPFKIPKEWPRAYGMDTGWVKTAVVWGAIDPNTDCLYLYDEYYQGQAVPAVHTTSIKSRGDWMYGAIDAAGTNVSDGTRIMHQYVQQGLKVFPADKGVDAGILCVYRRMSEGKLKIFSNLQNWLTEFRVYRRDDKNHVIKYRDHLMDATRYLAMTGVKAATVKPTDDDEEFYTPAASTGQSDITGY